MITEAKTAEQIQQVRNLLEQFEKSLDFSLDFQDFAEELETLPGRYAPPDGRLLLCEEEGTAAGCVALRNLGEGICEMKRLYVPMSFRGRGIGRALTEHALREARQIGYTHVRLDTVASMITARAIYDALGFYVIEPYTYNPMESAVFLEREL